MAEEKKAKIDLKARLGKPSTGAPPAAPSGAGGASASSAPGPISGAVPAIPPPPAAFTPMPPPNAVSPSGMAPPFPSSSAGSLGGAPIDPSNPLMAMVAPQVQHRPQPVAPPQPQRIEMDESAIEQARKDARKQGLIAGAVAAIAFLGVGYIAGGASETSAARQKSKKDAQELATDVEKARDQLKVLNDKLEAGRNMLIKERKFPDSLSRDLGGINIDFDGMKLAGRRFSGVSPTVTRDLIELITNVQAISDRKALIQGLLNKLQKPLTEQLNSPQGQQKLSYVAIISKDPAGNPSALLAPLSQPITFTPPNVTLPTEFLFTDPLSQGNAKLNRYTSGDISTKPAAVYVVPKTFEKICPSETAGQAAQLAAQLGNAIRDIQGEGQGAADAVQEGKVGLLTRATTLATELRKVE